MGNQENKDKLLELYNLSRLNHEEIFKNLNRPITSEEIEAVFRNLPTKNSPKLDALSIKFYQTFKEDHQSSVFQRI